MTECDLKPCPFCGHEPMFGKVRPATRKSPPLFGITCIHCGAEMTDEFVPELIRRWNARAAATASIDKEVMEGAFDKERRDVAARLWKHIGKPLFTGQDVEDIIGVQRSDFDVVLADASYRRLADLIEPEPERTCVRTLIKSGPVYDVWHFDCCDREYAENKTDAGATVVDMVEDWLEENGYDGLTDGRCSCTGGCLMHCGLGRSRRCSAAPLFPCTRCTHLTTCDRTTGTDVYSADADWCGEFEEA